jgi:hypothetical protein
MTFREKDINHTHSMTNKGLRIHFSTLTSTNSIGVIVKLACCFQDHSISLLGVRLVPEEIIGGRREVYRDVDRNTRGVGFYFGLRARESNLGLLIIPLKQAIHAFRKSMFVGHKI